MTAPETTPPPKSQAAFDIVRVEPGGSTLIAGTSVPGAKVRLMMNGEMAGETEADASGAFFLFAELGASDQPRVLTLSETWLDGTTVEAPASVILAPVPEVDLAALDTGESEGSDAPSDPAPVASDESPESAEPAPEVAVSGDAAPTQGEAGEEIAARAAPEVPGDAVQENAEQPVATNPTLPDATEEAPSSTADGTAGDSEKRLGQCRNARPRPSRSNPPRQRFFWPTKMACGCCNPRAISRKQWKTSRSMRSAMIRKARFPFRVAQPGRRRCGSI